MNTKELSDGRERKEALLRVSAILVNSGASKVSRIDPVDIVLDERVRLKCQVPLCESYGRNLTCPPRVPSVESFKRALKGYADAILVQVSESLTGEREDVFLSANKLHELINLGEKELFNAGFHLCAGFIGSCCRLCEDCVGAESGKACLHPFRARPSMSAMGIDVIETCRKAGFDVRFPLVDKVVWTGVILF